MRLLIPYDITTTGMKNPYLFLLMRELYKREVVTEIQHGFGWLWEEGAWDVIHLHWPELLVKSLLADMSRTDLLRDSHFEKVIKSIEMKKTGGSKVITTIHNETPHKDKTGQFGKFYKKIYVLSDGFIHMGASSKKLIENDYPKETAGKPSFVIPHGDYSYFPHEMKRAGCREKLGINEREKLLLSFGAIRSREELELGIDAFRQAGVENAIYMMAGSLPKPYRSQPEHFLVRKKLYANLFNRRIRTEERVIAPGEVQIYLKATDLLFIPRFNTLNSGNVALGFTFGKVVAGPDYGVIGEMLKETGNPVFNPNDLSSVSEAVREGFKQSAAGRGIKNKEYANRHMSWYDIAGKTVQAYQSL